MRRVRGMRAVRRLGKPSHDAAWSDALLLGAPDICRGRRLSGPIGAPLGHPVLNLEPEAFSSTVCRRRVIRLLVPPFSKALRVVPARAQCSAFVGVSRAPAVPMARGRRGSFVWGARVRSCAQVGLHGSLEEQVAEGGRQGGRCGGRSGRSMREARCWPRCF